MAQFPVPVVGSPSDGPIPLRAWLACAHPVPAAALYSKAKMADPPVL